MGDFIAGLILGMVLMLAIIHMIVRRTMATLEQHLEEMDRPQPQPLEALRSDNKARLRVEQIQDMFYIYDTVHDNFLAQGRSFLEIRNVLSRHHPDLDLDQVSGDAAAVQNFLSSPRT